MDAKQRQIELVVEREGEVTVLRSPEVGTYTAPASAGSVLSPGSTAGVLRKLGREYTLVVPRGCEGRVLETPKGAVHRPVGYRDELLRLKVLEQEAAAVEAGAADDPGADQGPVLRSPQTGRFYRRPSPDAPNFAEAGAELRTGTVVGLIEVMKTFTHVSLPADPTLPAHATLVEWLVEDGDEVDEGDPLLRLEARG